MGKEEKVEPKLIFFRQAPNNILSKPPLASSLQHLETSFILIALRRYPSALFSCFSAIESALKAAFGDDRNEKASELLNRAVSQLAQKLPFTIKEVNEFRQKRNRMIHSGFSPKDDESSAILLLGVGYPFIECIYETFFQYPLKRRDKKYGGLLPDIDVQLEIATRVYLKARGIKDLNLEYCFYSFAHYIRWLTQGFMLSDWQQEILFPGELDDRAFDYKHEQKEQLERKTFEIYWEFDCPVCNDPNSFVCEVDSGELEKKIIVLKRGVCVNCGLLIPSNCPFLANELCVDQVEKNRLEILDEYGIVD